MPAARAARAELKKYARRRAMLNTTRVAVLKAPKTSLALIMFTRKVYDAVLNNPNFPSPRPPLSVVAAHVNEFEDAESKAASRTKGAAAFRDAKKRRVVDDLNELRAYVQSVVTEGMTPAEAAAVIESAFMSVRKTPPRSIQEVSAKSGDVSGKVVLAAKSVAQEAVKDSGGRRREPAPLYAGDI